MVSFEHKYIYFHIPKTAGKSIYTMLPGGIHNSAAFPDIPVDGIGRRKMHLTALEIRQEMGHDKFNGYYKFAFVRNPWDRMISEFFWRKLRPKRRQFESLAQMLDFQLKGKAVEDDRNRHFLPQTAFLLDDNGESLMDFTGRFESLNADFRQVSEAMKLGITRSLPKLNPSKRTADYQQHYDEETEEMVRVLYRSDIDFFNYQFK